MPTTTICRCNVPGPTFPYIDRHQVKRFRCKACCEDLRVIEGMTDNEIEIVRAIAESEYGDAPGDPVWSNDLHTSLPATSVPGVCASLNSKKLAVSSGTGKEATIHLTSRGIAAFKEHTMTVNERKNVIKDRVEGKKVTVAAKVKPAPKVDQAKIDEDNDIERATRERKALKEAQKAAESKPQATDTKPKKDAQASDEGLLSVSDIARELGVDPKRARARLRSTGKRATDGRWTKVARDSKEHAEIIALLQPEVKKG